MMLVAGQIPGPSTDHPTFYPYGTGAIRAPYACHTPEIAATSGLMVPPREERG